MTSFATQLKYYMERANIGPEQLAKKIYKDRTTVYRWLIGQTVPRKNRQIVLDCIPFLRMRYANEADQLLQAAGHDILNAEEKQALFPLANNCQTILPNNKNHHYFIEHLPKPAQILVGREEQLQKLNQALQNPEVHFVSLIGEGGEGKSALMFGWLQRFSPEQLEKYHVVGWSFYSQGSHDTQTTSQRFFDYIFDLFEIPKTQIPSNNEAKGQFLAKILSQLPILLILDGLEPLQYPPDIQQGTLKDNALTAFIRSLSRMECHPAQLILINSRQLVIEFENISQHEQINLQHLTPNDGAMLLKQIGIHGETEELLDAVNEYQGYALSLTMLGYLIKNYYDSNIKQRKMIGNFLDKCNAVSHVERIIEFYQKFVWCEYERDGSLKTAFLCLIGLFDRPVKESEIYFLIRKSHYVKELKSTENDWKKVRKKLLALNLISEKISIHKIIEIDCHPIIRAWFGESFKKQEYKLYQQASQVLADYFSGLVAHKKPKNSQELEYLNRAIHHACNADNYRYALDLLQKRVLNGKGDYLFDNLYRDIGTHIDDLTVFADFFQYDWQYLPEQIDMAQQRWLNQAVSYALQFSGRLKETLRVTIPELRERIKTKDHFMAVFMARNASVSTACLGNMCLSKKYAKLAYEQACKTSHLTGKVVGMTTLGYATYLNGNIEEAINIFEEFFLSLEKYKSEPAYIDCYMIADVWYCRIFERFHGNEKLEILSKRVQNAIKELKKQENNRFLFNAPIVHANYGKILFSQNYKHDAKLEYEEAIEKINKANNLLMTPIVLRDCIEFYRRTKEYDAAADTIYEAYGITKRSQLKLFISDIKLQEVNLLLDTRPDDYLNKVEILYRKLSNLIFEMDYGLRFIELELLAARKAYHLEQPTQAQKHLENAQYMIEHSHQYGLYPQLKTIQQTES